MLRKRYYKLATLLLLLLLAVGCKTYTVTPLSFRIQLLEHPVFTQLDSTDSLFLGPVVYYTYDLDHIFVKDKKGNSKFLRNNPALECRITEVNGNNYAFYFDTMEFKNDTITGIRSFLFPEQNQVFINYDSIVRIEIQEGKKQYYEYDY